jgi:hypothetical protein
MNTSPMLWSRGFAGVFAAAALALTAIPLSVGAQEMRIVLSGDQEVPPVKTMASGSAMIRINPDMTVGGKVTTAGIAGTMAHIHLGAPGANGPVQVPLVRDGDNGWMVPGGSKLTEAQYKAFQAGNLYVNVHSAENKGGELRGQLKP